MKRLLIIFALVGSSFFTMSYAADTKTSPAVLHAFQISFNGAQEVAWEQVGVLYKASFVLDDQHAAAFYNSDGELVAVTKNISSLQLPKPLQASLKKERAGYWITDVFVVSIDGDDTYYVTLENAATTVQLKSAGTKKWAVYQRNEK